MYGLASNFIWISYLASGTNNLVVEYLRTINSESYESFWSYPWPPTLGYGSYLTRGPFPIYVGRASVQKLIMTYVNF